MTTESPRIPRIYCINLKVSSDRRHRMEHRFSYYHLLDRVTFIEAVPRDAPLIDYYHQNAVQQYPDTRKWRSEMACFASHLKAIRTFLEDGGSEALICEDDILLRNQFPDEYRKVRENMPDDAPLVSLSYMIVKWVGYNWAGKNPSLKNLCTMNPINTWGGQLYWISQKYAIQALTMFDKPYKLLSCEHTGEVILRHSKGYICYPLLAIEEGVDSERAPEDIPYHHRHFSAWGYENFDKAEKDHVAPYSGKCNQLGNTGGGSLTLSNQRRDSSTIIQVQSDDEDEGNEGNDGNDDNAANDKEENTDDNAANEKEENTDDNEDEEKEEDAKDTKDTKDTEDEDNEDEDEEDSDGDTYANDIIVGPQGSQNVNDQ
jgi:GR25 family glycosyltransferase involved in LPS biosynthesis